MMVTAPDGTEYNATFQFANDPNLTPEDYRRFGSDGTFSSGTGRGSPSRGSN